MKTELLDIRNMDCMELMKEYPDNHFDLAIVDPPYGSDNIQGGYTSSQGRVASLSAPNKNYNQALWGQDAPNESFFLELKRVSKNQIIWGANHFISKMPYDSPSWIVWDKQNTGSFADCELAYTSHKRAVRKFVFTWNGMIQGDMKNKEKRIHPTQKPVKLYDWIFANYAEEGMKILDTHMGSGSIAISAHYAKMHLTACELDEDYYREACSRIDKETAQKTLF